MSSNGIRIAAIVGAVALVVAAVALRGHGSSQKAATAPGATTQAPAPAGAVVVTAAYSPEKDALLRTAAREFEARHPTVAGHPVVVRLQNVASGAALDALRAGTLKPTIWTPSSSLWGRLLTQVADVSWVPERSVSFVRTPLVIAIWKQEAMALGWPAKPLGFADVLREAQNPQGFAAHGHPEWGAFRLGHTNPDFSTAGLSAVAAEYYAATGKTEGLTLADIEAPAVRAKIRAIESSVVHYGDTTLFFADQLARHGPAFASAVAMEEATLLDFNARHRSSQPLVAIYPKDGTFFSDDPLIVLNAPWVSASQRAAAAQFVAYLTSPVVQARVGAFGFRPSSETTAPTGLVTRANGADPGQPQRLLSLPEPKVLARIKALWHEDRKPADIALVLDTSGSMQDEGKLEQAQTGLRRFLGQLSRNDRVGLISFSESPHLVRPIATLDGPGRAAMQTAIDGLIADGGTAVYDATFAGLDLLARTGDPKHIQAVVVLTDGADNRSRLTAQRLVADLQGTAEASAPRVFTIAYGTDARSSLLRSIATAGNGKEYDGDPTNIGAVYTSISSFF
jgi:Ca-activated chloride channel family protein